MAMDDPDFIDTDESSLPVQDFAADDTFVNDDEDLTENDALNRLARLARNRRLHHDSMQESHESLHNNDWSLEDDQDGRDEHGDELNFGLVRGQSTLEQAINSLAAMSQRQQGALQDHPRLAHDGRSLFEDAIHRIIGGGDPFLSSLFSTELSDIAALVNNLANVEDSYIVLETLNEISERLLMMNGIAAERLVPSDKLSKHLLRIMQDISLQDEFELQVVACRCLYNLIEVNEDFVNDVMLHDAVMVLCEKLRQIENIDLRDQALQTLEVISRDPMSHKSIVDRDGLVSCLSYLDFMTLHSQKKCLYICLNVCSNVGTTEFSKIKEAFPDICAATSSPNEEITEQAWQAISRLVFSYRMSPDLLELLFANSPELLRKAMPVIIGSVNVSTHGNSDSGESRLSFKVCLDLVKSIVILQSVSVAISLILIRDCKIGDVLIRCLGRFLDNGQVTIGALMAAPKRLVSQFIDVIAYLVPIAPSTQLSLESQALSRLKLNTERLAVCEHEIPNEFNKFLVAIIPILIKSFQAWLDFSMRRKILVILSRILSLDAASSLLQELEGITNILISVTGSYVARAEANPVAESSSNDDSVLEPIGDTSVPNFTPHIPATRRGSGRSDVATRQKLDSLTMQALIVARSLVSLHSRKFTEEFEKEGLFDDVLVISKSSTGSNLGLDTFSFAGAPVPPTNLYSDPEIADDADLRPRDESLASMISKYALLLLQEYTKFQSNQKHYSSLATSNLEKFTQLLSDLQDYTKLESYAKEDWLNFWERVWVILGDGSEVVKLTSYELIASNFVILLCVLFGKSPDFPINIDRTCCSEAFASVFFTGHDHSLVRLLVDKLHDSLLRPESFEVVTCGFNAGELSHGSSQPDSIASVLTSQVKLKLVVTDPQTPQLPLGMQKVILSVHAIATFKSVAEFLKSGFGHSSLHLTDNNLNGIVPESGSGESSEHSADDDRYEFFIDGTSVSNSSTVFGAVYRALEGKHGPNFDVSDVWNAAHQVEARAKVGKSQATCTDNSPRAKHASTPEFPGKKTRSVLDLLSAIFEITTTAQVSSHTDLASFQSNLLNWQLAAKLNRQLDEILVVTSGVMPEWTVFLVTKYPFLFPFETRIRYFQSTSFGYLRIVQAAQSRLSGGSSDSDTRHDAASNGLSHYLGRSSRQKVRISRDQILRSAIKVLTSYGTTPRTLEIEFCEEIGSGLGPTLEFYALVSREFHARELELWRHDGSNIQAGFSQHPLFPRPLGENQRGTDYGRKILHYFERLGMFVARALIDSRILDFNFCPSWLAILQQLNSDQDRHATRADMINALEGVDPSLANSIKFLQGLEGHTENANGVYDPIGFDGSNVEELALTFELPGYPDYELIPEGSQVPITTSNLSEYIDKVLDATLGGGIVHQTLEFKRGFSEILDAHSLNIFSPVELTQVFGNAMEDWSSNTLTSVVVANHGYSKGSEAIKSLVLILEQLDIKDRRKFLLFLTGSPRLPIGGFRALDPPITVVRKFADEPLTDDDYLPSVMTCVNYLKLPNYSGIDVMRKRLFQAMNEGAGSFFLS